MAVCHTVAQLSNYEHIASDMRENCVTATIVRWKVNGVNEAVRLIGFCCSSGFMAFSLDLGLLIYLNGLIHSLEPDNRARNTI